MNLAIDGLYKPKSFNKSDIDLGCLVLRIGDLLNFISRTRPIFIKLKLDIKLNLCKKLNSTHEINIFKAYNLRPS